MRARSVIILSFLLPLRLPAQPSEQLLPGQHRLFVTITVPDSVYRLPHEFIVPESERILLDSVRLLSAGPDYTMRYREGEIILSTSLLEALPDDSVMHRLFISYRYSLLPFRREYRLRELPSVRDTIAGKPVLTSRPTPRFGVDDLFGPGLQKSGSLVRGFTIGSNRDLTLNSGFRLQLSGKLSEDIDIVAALTDENSPIQPEGTTRTLQEVDKVFVELSSRQYSATLGDFNVRLRQSEVGEFAQLFRKLQGAQGMARGGNVLGTGIETELTVIGASTRGKFHSMQFQGLEGNQGPYQLTSREGERRVLVVAGTERVYVNGEPMTRGETQDYTIDYASGEILFTTRRLITNASRITVDYEYSDRRFTRNLLGTMVRGSALDDRLKVNALIVQEADDADSPIDYELDESARRILSESGSNRFRASVGGVRFAGRDSITNAARGQYVRKDTTIGGRKYVIYDYAPGHPEALYAVAFSYIDRMPPDSAGYARIGAGQYRFAGIGQGNYLPIQFLPIPQLNRLAAGRFAASVASGLTVSGDFAASSFDRNRLSSLDDGERSGGAYKIGVRYNTGNLRIGGASIGELDLQLSERLVGQKFSPLDRTNEIEFNRKWDLAPDQTGDERIREASLVYHPDRSIAIEAGYGSLERTGTVSSERITFGAALSDSSLPKMSYRLENIGSSSSLLDEESSWLRQRGTAEWGLWMLLPGLRVEAERREQKKRGDGTLSEGSFRFLEIAPRFGLAGIGRMDGSVEVQFRREDSSAVGLMRHASNSITQLYTWRLREWNAASSLLSLTIRNTDFTDEFRSRGNVDSDVILVRSETRLTPWQRMLEGDVFYEFSGQRSAQLERVFVRVPKGSGNYRYRGDVNNNGIADEEEFELTRFDGDFIVVFLPGDRLVPVAELKTGGRIRLQPARILPRPSTFFERVLNSVSTETFVRVEERSSDPNRSNVYLLRLNTFQNDATTIAGSNQFTQDVNLFEHSREASIRFRFQERRGFLRLVQANERSYERERSVRARMQLVKEIGNQTDFINRVDRVEASAESPRERDLISNFLQTEFSYRPEPQWEIAVRTAVSRVTDRFGGSERRADINEQAIRLTYALAGAGQVRGELQREEVGVTVPRGYTRELPFEFTGGKAVGKSFLWQVAIDYRFGRYLQFTVNYHGRTEGGRAPVHTARAEARAVF